MLWPIHSITSPASSFKAPLPSFIPSTPPSQSPVYMPDSVINAYKDFLCFSMGKSLHYGSYKEVLLNVGVQARA